MEKKGKILLDRYKLGGLLGQGNFAKVYYAKRIKDGEEVAVKVLNKEKILKIGLDLQIIREITVMKMLRHPNIIQVHEVMATRGNVYIVIEYAKCGDLFNVVSKARLGEDLARWYFQQLITAVDFCHRRGVYHRDLKLENLLVDEFGNLKISDFGLSALVDSAQQDKMLRTFCGTPTYVAPEVIRTRLYDGAKNDIWSCGVILFAMLAGRLPFVGSNQREIYRRMVKAEYKFPNWFPPDVRRLLAKILDPNHRTRISIAKIMESPWFRRGFGRGSKTIQAEAGLAAAAAPPPPQLFVNESETSVLRNINAFEIISLSTGFDLSGLFVEDERREDVRFTCTKPALAIVSRMEEIAATYQLRVVKKADDGRCLRMCGHGEGGRVGAMVDVEIAELAPSFQLVEMKKSGGDSLVYRKIVREYIKPGLGDIVWAWQGQRITEPVDLLEPMQA